jgi:hypothetical protein
MLCPNCGGEVTDEVAYCFSCFRHVFSPAQVAALDEDLFVAADPTVEVILADQTAVAVDKPAVPAKAPADLIAEHVAELEKMFQSFKESPKESSK